MKPIEIDLKSVISAKYLMPEKMLIAYLERFNLAMPLNKIGRERADFNPCFTWYLLCFTHRNSMGRTTFCIW